MGVGANVVAGGREDRAIGLLVLLGMISVSEKVVHPQKVAYLAEETGDKLLSVIGKNVLWRSVTEHPVVYERPRYIKRFQAFHRDNPYVPAWRNDR